ncbi:alpha/beta fold hydrolase [Sphingobium nicotianae]|uniref:Alpha/beta hydrolase n=1 Tax=Sphingobium nicotianae TaxID=2782607 RepID=A0A9X1DCR0_9SPHN|nr:alpha/beta hydrolase [Sphingobium nicotianae]MBT2187598.1 alpha/beta hydrolase [Sphingobium nicotianae]
MPDAWTNIAIPAQAAAKEGLVNIGPARLWFWDTGGKGEVVVLNHSDAQSSECWKYQQPVLAKAGYRVIGWSRRGTFRSERRPQGNPGTGSADLARLLDLLKVDACHLVGSAEGAAVAVHFALEHPARARSLLLSGGRLGVAEDDYRDMDSRTRLPANHNTAPSFAEIGASYRGGNPTGTKSWAEGAAAAHPAGTGPAQPAGAQPLNWARVSGLKTPVMLLTGDCDHYSSASQNRLIAQHLPNRELAVIQECSTAAYWEQPDAFNAVLLDFLRRHRGGTSLPPASNPAPGPTYVPLTSRSPTPAIVTGPVKVWEPIPVPAQVPAKEGYADTSPVKIWHWDTGGDGEAIVFCHPWSQSSECWKYQQPFFAKRGYRVIGWSARGFYKTEKGPAENPGSSAEDLHKLMDYLKVDKFHIVGCAAGGCTTIAYAIAHPERLHSVLVSGSILLPTEPEYDKFMANLGRGPANTGAPTNVPVEFAEVGASYRAGDPEGLAAWQALEHIAHPGGWFTSQPWGAERNWRTFAAMTLPIMLQTGDTDMGPSPALMRFYTSRFPNWEMRVLREAGHASYWEQPEAFNASVLDFVSRHGAKA